MANPIDPGAVYGELQKAFASEKHFAGVMTALEYAIEQGWTCARFYGVLRALGVIGSWDRPIPEGWGTPADDTVEAARNKVAEDGRLALKAQIEAGRELLRRSRQVSEEVGR